MCTAALKTKPSKQRTLPSPQPPKTGFNGIFVYSSCAEHSQEFLLLLGNVVCGTKVTAACSSVQVILV